MKQTPGKAIISDAFFRREYVDYMLAAVVLEDFKPSSTSLAILRHINNALGTNSLSVGGSLRDEYRAQMIKNKKTDQDSEAGAEKELKTGTEQQLEPKDYDVHVSVTDTTEARNDIRDYSEGYMIRRATETLLRAPGFKLISEPEIIRIGSGTNKHYYGNLVLGFSEKIVDIGLTMDRISLAERAMYGDAVVNSIAADASGTTMAHPHFEEDMENENHAIRVTNGYDLIRSNERFSEKARAGHYLGTFELEQPDEYFASLDFNNFG